MDTLEALREKLGPRVQMRLLIGTDQMLAFDRWYRWARIVELAEPAVMVRPPQNRAELLAQLPEPNPWRDRLLDLPIMDARATDLRRRLARGESTAGLIDPNVRAYIDEHGLYRD